MSKELEIYYEMKHYLSLEWSDIEDLMLVEKSLKALEIIKEKQVDIKWCGNLPPLLQQTYAISQEEYDLLKEIL